MRALLGRVGLLRTGFRTGGAKAPRIHQPAHANIKRPPRLLADVQGGGQHRHEFFGQDNPLLFGQGVEAAQV